MKKFLYPLPLFSVLLCGVFLFNCSSDGFEKPKSSDLASWAGLDSLYDAKVKCFVGESCYEISKSACNIIGGEEDSTKNCVSFSCGWDNVQVDYGQESILSYAAQEGCSVKMSPLDTGKHTISASAIAGLSFLKDTSIVAQATVTCGTEPPIVQIVQNCKPLKVKPIPFNFSCSWTPEQVKYGEKSTLHFAFGDQASANLAQKEGCSLKISPLDSGEHIISASTIAGLSYSRDTTIIAKATMTCGASIKSDSCSALKVDSIHGPVITGDLFFKKPDYKSNDTNYFFIGTEVKASDIDNTITITNKKESGCDSVKIEITGSPAKLGTQVRATAIATCPSGKFELDGISAEVLPNPVIKGCTLGNNSQYYMHRGESLTLNVVLDDVSGRCKDGIEYSLNGTTYGTSLSLSSSSGKLSNIKARAKCSGNFTTESVNCPEIFVAEGYIGNARCNHQDIFPAGIKITKTTTVIEYACCEPKTDYKITQCGSANFTLSIDGTVAATSKDSEATLPDRKLTLIAEPNAQCTVYGDSPGGILYRYPKRVLMTVTNTLPTGGFECNSW